MANVNFDIRSRLDAIDRKLGALEEVPQQLLEVLEAVRRPSKNLRSESEEEQPVTSQLSGRSGLARASNDWAVTSQLSVRSGLNRGSIDMAPVADAVNAIPGILPASKKVRVTSPIASARPSEIAEAPPPLIGGAPQGNPAVITETSDQDVDVRQVHSIPNRGGRKSIHTSAFNKPAGGRGRESLFMSVQRAANKKASPSPAWNGGKTSTTSVNVMMDRDSRSEGTTLGMNLVVPSNPSDQRSSTNSSSTYSTASARPDMFAVESCNSHVEMRLGSEATSVVNNEHGQMLAGGDAMILDNGIIVERVHDSCMLLPDSIIRLVWDVLVAVTIIYTTLVIPVGLSYFPASELKRGLFALPFIVTDAMWLIDIVFNFRTGAIDRQGWLVSDQRLIALQYAKGWLWLDVITAWPPSLAPGGQIGLRLVFSVKLLRMFRLNAAYIRLQRHRTSSSPATKLIVGMVILSHIMSCSWYLAQWAGGMIAEPEDSSGWHDQYIKDTYYILTTMTTVGYGDITPTTTATRLHSIGLMLISSVFFGLVISTLTHVMSGLFHDHVEERLAEALRFMKRRGVPQEIQYRVERSIRHHLTQTNQAVMDQELFELLSPGLQNELSLSLLGSAVLRFPLFQGSMRSFIAELAQAHSWIQSSPCDLVAEVGQVVEEMVFVVQGRLVAQFGQGSQGKFFDVSVATIKVKNNQSRFKSGRGTHVFASQFLGVGAWFGESSLFERRHVRTATFIAALASDLATLPGIEYIRIVAKYPLLLDRHKKISADLAQGRLQLSSLAYKQNQPDEAKTRSIRGSVASVMSRVSSSVSLHHHGQSGIHEWDDGDSVDGQLSMD